MKLTWGKHRILIINVLLDIILFIILICGAYFGFFFSFLGNPAIGVLKHKEKYYVFSSKEDAYIFAEDPDKFIQLNIEKAKKYAELIQLLELHHQFEYLVPHTQVHTAHASC